VRPEKPTSPSLNAVTLDDLRRSERLMLGVRATAIPWALLQILTYTTLPYPDGVKGAGLIIVAGLAAAVAMSRMLLPRARTHAAVLSLGITGLAADIMVVSGFAWLFAFDQESALWAILLIIPLEGAIRFQLRGALWTWTAVTILYIAREVWGSDRYGYRLQWDSVTFRMGIGLMIALVAGLMARDLVRQRAQLRRVNEELRRTDAIRSALVTTLAHDVRNPLTAIRGTFSVLRRSELDPRLAELVNLTDRSAARLERLSLGLLDLARLEQGRLDLNFRSVRVTDAVGSAVRFADPDGAVESVTDPTLTVRADPDRLEQVLVNLITNALRYGDPPVTVSAEAAGEKVRIRVRDRGAGVSPAERDHLFEPFRPREAKGSVGFGLTIVKALTEASGGRVFYEDAEPGAAFVVELPAGGGVSASSS